MSVVNLNKQRKNRAKAEKKRIADENAVRFGRTKTQKKSERIETEHSAKKTDGHRLDR